MLLIAPVAGLSKHCELKFTKNKLKIYEEYMRLGCASSGDDGCPLCSWLCGKPIDYLAKCELKLDRAIKVRERSNWRKCPRTYLQGLHYMTDVFSDNIVLHATFACIFSGILLALAIVDFQKMILPNRLNLSLAAAGLGRSIIIGQPGVIDAFAGAFLGVACLMLVAALFRRVRGVDGLGLGDVKFIAAAGMWTGWQGIPAMLFVASISALAFFAVRAARQGAFDRSAPLPFGPFLGLGAFCVWLAITT